MKRTIRAGDIKDKLVFHDSNEVPWEGFSGVRGQVGIFVKEYGPDWDRFIVIERNDDRTYSVIFPRMKLHEPSGQVLLGKDKLQENYTTELSSCQYHAEYTWDCYYCCKSASYVYTDAFTSVDDEYEYHIVKIKQPIRSVTNFVWWGAVCKKRCKRDLCLLAAPKYKAQVQRNQCRYASVVILGVAKRKRAFRDVLGLVAKAMWALRNKK